MEKLSTAKEQLDDACDLFCRDRFGSALTLAGAAEEVLGTMVRDRFTADGSKIKHALGERVSVIAHLKGTDPEDKKEQDRLIAFLNHPRNAAKHLHTNKGVSRVFNLREEALDMIERAVLNYRRATGHFPDSESFYRFRGEK